MEKSPCVRICTLNLDKICIGCGRSVDEIKNWINFNDDKKASVKAQLKSRLAETLQKMRTKKL